MLRQRRKREKRPRIKKGPDRVWPKHREWVRKHACSVHGCAGQPIEFAHLRTAANSGTGSKPHDGRFGIALCREHHRRAHDAGHETMATEEGMSMDELFKIADAFYRRSPDAAMRKDFEEWGNG